MKKTLILILLFISLNIMSQDIFNEEREPIVVETKADLQTELALEPIDFGREEKPDSLLKFNYAYHGNPLRSDYNLFPQKPVRLYLNLGSGNNDIVDFSNYFRKGNFTQQAKFLMRKDEGEREAKTFNFSLSYDENNHHFEYRFNHLYTDRENPLTHNSYQNWNDSNTYFDFCYAYTPLSSKYYIDKFTLKAQMAHYDQFEGDDRNSNIFIQLQVNPYKDYFANFKVARNHDHPTAQMSFFYEKFSKLGFWTATNADKNLIIAPEIDLYYNYQNLTLLLSNKPFVQHNSFIDQHVNNLYGNHYEERNVDSIVPGNGVVEISYFNLLTWSLGSHYQYFVDSPVYRLGDAGEKVHKDSYWRNSAYAKLHYQIKNLQLTTKGEIINYNNFDADFLPFTPEWRFTLKAQQDWRRLSLGLDYIIEAESTNDHNIALDDSHIFNLNANFRLTKSISLWAEVINLLDNDNNDYVRDEINRTEFKAGVKLFF